MSAVSVHLSRRYDRRIDSTHKKHKKTVVTYGRTSFKTITRTVICRSTHARAHTFIARKHTHQRHLEYSSASDLVASIIIYDKNSKNHFFFSERFLFWSFSRDSAESSSAKRHVEKATSKRSLEKEPRKRISKRQSR